VTVVRRALIMGLAPSVVIAATFCFNSSASRLDTGSSARAL
jgi:hypothetical protein